jgi:hypothetical protein
MAEADHSRCLGDETRGNDDAHVLDPFEPDEMSMAPGADEHNRSPTHGPRVAALYPLKLPTRAGLDLDSLPVATSCDPMPRDHHRHPSAVTAQANKPVERDSHLSGLTNFE